MPCLCPISIPDKALAAFGVRGQSLTVPCGHCAGCAKDRRNDWFVRIWSEYNNFRSKHLPVWFVTVTIDPSLFPDMTLSSPGVGSRITPFMRSWKERLRYLNGGKMPKCFLCSEFGSEGKEYTDHSGRVRVTCGALHFHGLIFGKLDVSSIRRGLSITHGYVDFDLIRGPRGIRYVVKYATKDFSIDDPSLRARVFASPGIGDPSFYFGTSSPTSIVLINGFHYRVPRYLIDKQWIAVYSKPIFEKSLMSNFMVDQRALVRRRAFNVFNSRVSALRAGDPSYFEYCKGVWKKQSTAPTTLSDVLKLQSLRLCGASHPLIRRRDRAKSDASYANALYLDTSFINCKPYCSISQFFTYERGQTFVPLSLDFTS